MRRIPGLLKVVGLVVLLAGCSVQGNGEKPYAVVLDQLDEPRGLWLDGDGTLCVAEAGRLADGQVVDEHDLTVLADTGALTCVDKAGERRRVIEHLPYVLYSVSGDSIGPADVAELDGVDYLLTGEGYGELSRKLLRLDPAGPPQPVADFLKFAAQGKPLAYFQPASMSANPFAMIPDAAHQRFLVTDGASGQVMVAGLDGKIAIYSPVDGHEVLTGITWGPDGLAYVASFSQLPHAEGQGAIVRVHPDGTAETVLTGLTTPIDVAFDRAGQIYVLEFVYASADSDPYRDKTGRLLRFSPQGEGWTAGQVLVEGIPYPTAMLFGPKDSLYMSVHGAFSAPQTGAVVRFDDLLTHGPGQAPIQFGR